MATRFWVGGTGTWDSVTTTHWAATTGGAGGVSVPGAADTVTFDGASGGGTVTVNFGGTITIQSLTCGAHTGTLDFSVNNNSVTLSAGAASTPFSGSGSATRTLNLGNGTWSLTGNINGNGIFWAFGTTTGLTFNANGSTIVYSSATSTGAPLFQGGGLTYNNVTLNNTGRGGVNITGANTFATLTILAPNTIFIPPSSTQTVTNLILTTPSVSNPILIESNSVNTAATISSANSPSLSWFASRLITYTGGGTFTATSSFDFGGNTGITITAPAAGTSGGFIIGD